MEHIFALAISGIGVITLIVAVGFLLILAWQSI